MYAARPVGHAGYGGSLASRDPGTWVRFDAKGLAHTRDNREDELFAWSDVRDLEIRVPYSTMSQWRAIDGFNLVSPKYGQHSTWYVGIFFRSGYREVAWNLGRSGRYPWQLDFLLDDLLQLLDHGRNFAALARPGLLDRLVSDVMPTLPRRARLLMYVDLLGLDRFVGDPRPKFSDAASSRSSSSRLASRWASFSCVMRIPSPASQSALLKSMSAHATRPLMLITDRIALSHEAPRSWILRMDLRELMLLASVGSPRKSVRKIALPTL